MRKTKVILIENIYFRVNITCFNIIINDASGYSFAQSECNTGYGKDFSVVKNTAALTEDWSSVSIIILDGSQPAMTAAPGDLMLCSDLCRYQQTPSICREMCIHTQK